MTPRKVRKSTETILPHVNKFVRTRRTQIDHQRARNAVANHDMKMVEEYINQREKVADEARSRAVSILAAHEVPLDNLPSRVSVQEQTGNGETHHARLMRAVLEILEGL